MNRWIICIGASIMFSLVVGPLAAEDFTGANGAPKWKVYDYNGSAKELRSRVPSLIQTGGIGFDFLYTPSTALLVTSFPGYRGSLLGSLTGTVSATVAVTAIPGTVFDYSGEQSCGGTNAYVRFFFEKDTSGEFSETNYWWSNPVDVNLSDLVGTSMTISASLSDGSKWSDFYGHFGNDPAYSAAFNAALSDVGMIGLSFGGGCFLKTAWASPPESARLNCSAFRSAINRPPLIVRRALFWIIPTASPQLAVSIVL